AVAPSGSATVSVMFAVPVRPAAGVTVTVRVAPVPVTATFPSGTRAGLSDRAVTVNWSAGDSVSPTVTVSGLIGVPTTTDWLGTVVIVGGVFAATLTVNVSVAGTPNWSRTVRVTVAVPLAPRAGVRVTVRSAPVPPRVTPPA